MDLQLRTEVLIAGSLIQSTDRRMSKIREAVCNILEIILAVAVVRRQLPQPAIQEWLASRPLNLGVCRGIFNKLWKSSEDFCPLSLH